MPDYASNIKKYAYFTTCVHWKCVEVLAKKACTCEKIQSPFQTLFRTTFIV